MPAQLRAPPHEAIRQSCWYQARSNAKRVLALSFQVESPEMVKPRKKDNRRYRVTLKVLKNDMYIEPLARMEVPVESTREVLSIQK